MDIWLFYIGNRLINIEFFESLRMKLYNVVKNLIIYRLTYIVQYLKNVK